jgi:hypothetical protein
MAFPVPKAPMGYEVSKAKLEEIIDKMRLSVGFAKQKYGNSGGPAQIAEEENAIRDAVKTISQTLGYTTADAERYCRSALKRIPPVSGKKP